MLITVSKNRPYALTSRLHNNDAMLGVKTCRAARTCFAGRAHWRSPSQSVCAPGPARRWGMQGFALWVHAWRWCTWRASFDPQHHGGALLWRHMHMVYSQLIVFWWQYITQLHLDKFAQYQRTKVTKICLQVKIACLGGFYSIFIPWKSWQHWLNRAAYLITQASKHWFLTFLFGCIKISRVILCEYNKWQYSNSDK